MKTKSANRPLNKHFFLNLISLCMSLFRITIVLGLCWSPHVTADIWDELKSHDDKVLEYDEELYDLDKPAWEEAQITLPDYPHESDLIAITGSSAYQHFQYLIDLRQLRIDPDKVVRYTIVIITPGGAQNVIFEGLRCSAKKYKTYAYGNANKFINKKNASWRPLSSQSVMGYTRSLADNYFCNNLGDVLKRSEIVQNIKYGKGNVDGWYIK